MIDPVRQHCLLLLPQAKLARSVDSFLTMQFSRVYQCTLGVQLYTECTNVHWVYLKVLRMMSPCQSNVLSRFHIKKWSKQGSRCCITWQVKKSFFLLCENSIYKICVQISCTCCQTRLITFYLYMHKISMQIFVP